MKYRIHHEHIEDLKHIDIKDFNKHFKDNVIFNGKINWRSGNALRFEVSKNDIEGVLRLFYRHEGRSITYSIDLTSKPSNLGRGVVWYFLCPKSGKRCRKLYLQDGVFIHRENTGKYYEQQTQGKRQRLMYLKAVRDSISEEVYNEIYKPYRRYTYAGKPTKIIQRLNKRAKKTEGVDWYKVWGMKK